MVAGFRGSTVEAAVYFDSPIALDDARETVEFRHTVYFENDLVLGPGGQLQHVVDLQIEDLTDSAGG
jgi:hypothetical protein